MADERARVKAVPDHAALNVAFGASLVSCAWFFAQAIRLDPGTVKGPGIGEELKEVRSPALRSFPSPARKEGC